MAWQATRMSWSRSDSGESVERDFGANTMTGPAGYNLQLPGQPGHRGVTVEIPLEPELLNTLYRRSRRRLRDIQSSCRAALKLDRARGVLRATGSEDAVQAVRRQLENLSGPVKPLPVAVWAELMRTRTLKVSPKASIARMQAASGCRIHIERCRHEVRLFGPNDGVVVANRLLDEFSEMCGEEAVPLADPTTLSPSVLQAISHSFGITLCVEDRQIKVLGLKEPIGLAVAKLHEYLADPHGIDLGSLPEAPESQEPQEPPAQPERERPRQEPKQQQVAQGPRDGNRRLAQQAQQRHSHSQGGDFCCPTCGAGRFCSSCGAPVCQHFIPSNTMMVPSWAMNAYGPSGGNAFGACEVSVPSGDARGGSGEQQPSMFAPQMQTEPDGGGTSAMPRGIPAGPGGDNKMAGNGFNPQGQHMQQAYMMPYGTIPPWCGL